MTVLFIRGEVIYFFFFLRMTKIMITMIAITASTKAIIGRISPMLGTLSSVIGLGSVTSALSESGEVKYPVSSEGESPVIESVSVSGSVCNPRAEKIREAARRIPADRLLVETDTPDLFPAGGAPAGSGGDGKPLNQPSNLARVLTELAALRNVPPETLAVITRANAQRFFYGHTGNDRRQ